ITGCSTTNGQAETRNFLNSGEWRTTSAPQYNGQCRWLWFCGYKKTAPERGSRGVNQFLLCREAELVYRRGTAHFVTDGNVMFAQAAEVLDGFRCQIAGFRAVSTIFAFVILINFCAYRLVEVAVIHIALEDRCLRITDIKHHHTTLALQSDKGKMTVTDGGGFNGFRFDAFVIAAVIRRAINFVIGVKMIRLQPEHLFRDEVAAVVDQFASRIPDGERTGAIGEQSFICGNAVTIADKFQFFQLVVVVQRSL